MSLYLKPPKGLTNLHNLEETVTQRFKCYENLESENILEIISQLDCLMEDSVMDRLGHFLFRLTAFKSTNFQTIFLQKEVKLLEIRLGCYPVPALRGFFKKLRRQAKDLLESPKNNSRTKEFIEHLIRICNCMLNREYFEHCNHENRNCRLCQEHMIISVPFHLCLDLLASRSTKIIQGFLKIEPFQWKHLVLSFYKTYLSVVLKDMSSLASVKLALEDERISDVVKFTKFKFFKNLGPTEKSGFEFRNFERDAELFPLCMSHLYEVLRTNHRLGHNDRYDFSLFLKSIGMTMSDSIKFWEQAYSKQHASCSKCTHSWKESEKRYIYGIRHMYGLEGSRKNYSCRTCHQIESTLPSPNQDGGCPFKKFNDVSLTSALKRHLPNCSSAELEVIVHQRKTDPRKACTLNMEKRLEVMKISMPETGLEFFNPADYYLLLKRLTKVTEV